MPTRRSSRRLSTTATSSLPASVETRAALRHRTGDIPVVVPDRIVVTDATSSTEPAPADATPLTRRRARAARTTPVASTETTTFDVGPSASDDSEPVSSTYAEESPAPAADAFEAAARLFSFTGETPVQLVEDVPTPSASPVSAPSVAEGRRRIAARRMTGASFRRLAATSFTVGVMGVVGLMTVGMTTPAEAVGANSPTSASTVPAGDVYAADAGEIQAYVAPAEVAAVDLGRTENYATATLVDLAGTEGISNFSTSVFVNDPNCSIQWPFATGVTMSYGFGMRSGRMHEGTDFTPGAGAHIQAIDDGVVRISTDSGGAFGVTILIDHIVDGQLVSSRYAHMQFGSRQVQVGDHVTVGQFIGKTGNTGRSFGAHTHVEILQNGTTPIDPLPWLRAHATC